MIAEDRAAFEPVYEASLMKDLAEILEAIPPNELAIQWDTAVEFGILEGVFPTFLENKQSDILERLIRLGQAIPDEVEVGYHLCYGDSGHKHFVEPTDTAILVLVANGLAQNLNRTLNWIHLPVPKNRIDESYYLPLQQLELAQETTLYLGLIHFTDGIFREYRKS